MIHILIVDDQKMFREALKTLLESEPDLEIVGIAKDGYSAIEQVEALRPDVVLMDMEMPKLDGVSATKTICQRFPSCKVLVLSNHDDDEYVAKALHAGAMGYLLKTIPAQELRKAIRFLHKGYARIRPGLYAQVVPTFKGMTSTIKTVELAEKLSLELGATSAPPNSSALQLLERENRGAIERRENEPPERPNAKEISWLQVLAMLIVGVGLTGGIYLVRQFLRQPLPSLNLSQQAATLADTKFPGKIEPARTFKIAATTPSVVENIYVKIGQPVKAGQPLLAVQNLEAQNALSQRQQQLQAALQQQQLALQQQQTARGRILELTQEIDRISRTEIPLASQIAEAELQVSLAQSQVDTVPLPQRQDSIERTQAIYQRALSKVHRFTELYQEGAIAKDQLEQAQADLQVARADFQVAREAAQATAALKAARQEKSRYQLRSALNAQQEKLKQLQQQLQTARLEYAQATERLELLRKQTSQLSARQTPQIKTIVKATSDGIAIELPVAVGEQIFTGNPLIGLAQLSNLTVEVPVSARLINALYPGQSAAIAVGVGENTQKFTGKIASINPLPDGELNHTVEIQFANPKQALLIGQVATVEFLQ
ncbi:response regulator [Pleurocapsa sp. PCC 7327]|uniref:response regulator n=1 Tax=Pleurocapsa sp. PCC 7327 TaxID=118163 RepID=UPI00068833CD|nr:response regulator [Pleurocapsa sp. PCC 7327]